MIISSGAQLLAAEIDLELEGQILSCPLTLLVRENYLTGALMEDEKIMLFNIKKLAGKVY